MADNKGKIDQLHDLLPRGFNSRNNANWKAMVEAFGEQDQKIFDLISEVRKQFFVKTASRPYLDRLGANNKIARPKLVGMDDPSFRQYIPILSYQPKQVKLIIDKLLDVFFFKESTTAFITTQNFGPFNFDDGWELELFIDEQYTDRVVFTNADFTDIHAATANETVAAINRQTKHCYATSYYDSITKNTYIRIFTNTIGSKGSLRIKGGRINTAIRLNGFIDAAGVGSNTQWSVTKVGDEVVFQYVGGTSPAIDQLQVGDIAIINIPGNVGSFEIKSIDLVNNNISFKNLFATVGLYTQTSEYDIKFIRPKKYVAYTNVRRAMTWETTSGEVVVEIPTSPPVVKRSLRGSFHTNGVFSQMSNRDSDNSMTLVDAYLFPESGSFVMEESREMLTRMLTSSENEIVSKKNQYRLQHPVTVYEFSSRTVLNTTGDILAGTTQITNLASTVGIQIGQQVSMDGVPGYSRVVSISGSTVNISFPASSTILGGQIKFLGNTLNGITPSLPKLASLNEYSLSSITRVSDVVTATTSMPNDYVVGEYTVIYGCDGILVASETGDTTNLSNTILNLSSTSGIVPGMLVAGPGIPIGTTVVSVGISSIIISDFATATSIGVNLTFSENLNGAYKIESVSGSTFSFTAPGSNGTPLIPGSVRVERMGLSNSGSKIIVLDAIHSEVSRISGSYVWDKTAPYVLSSSASEITDEIKAGKIVRLLNTTANTMPDSGGYVIFDYGRENQEGPVRYLYKPTDNTLAIDPSYTFQHGHSVGSPVIAISKKGPHAVSTSGKEYSPYITDPSEARFILQDLVKSIKSAGIFVNFLVRYPEQLYGVLDVYNEQNLGAGAPFSD